jgi:hypothetical protein
MSHMTKTLSPPSKPPRVSVPVTAEVLEAFDRLAKAGNMSVGRAIAEWLGDTVEAAQFMASKMEQARAAPKVVMRELHAYALAMTDETGALMRDIAEKGRADRAASKRALPRTVAVPPIPPSCNTGGKVPKVQKGAGVLKPGFPVTKAKPKAGL